MEKISGIYKITNIINNKIYIGSSQDIYKRKANHLSCLRWNTHINRHLQYSYNKHGIENFKFEILARCPKEYLIKLEQWFLDNLKPHYNIKNIAEPTLKWKWKEYRLNKKVININTGEIYENVKELSNVFDIDFNKLYKSVLYERDQFRFLESYNKNK